MSGEKHEAPAIPPTISVVVPTHRCDTILPETLGALRESDLPDREWELIVVDDSSGDRTPDVAGEFADEVIRLEGKPRGPSYARNRGAEAASGEILVFIDSDVRVRPNTLSEFLHALQGGSDVVAVFGSYDADPPAGGPVSRYRNLLHHWTHQENPGDAETFWAGCGAIRRSVFFDVGMYDEWHFSRPEIEDIELGRRIRNHGYRILLRPDIQVTHLKEWTLRNVLSTDFRNRGVPWARLILHEGRSQASTVLNVDTREKICSALAASTLPAALAAVVLSSVWPLAVAAVSTSIVLGTNRRFYRFLGRRGGLKLVSVSVPLHFLYYIQNSIAAVTGWFIYHVVGPPHPPVDVAAFRDANIDTDPPLPAPPAKSMWLNRGSSDDDG